MNLAESGQRAAVWAKQVYMAEAKAGKTTWLVASLLGALPHQKESVVTRPSDLHLLGFDEAFADGLADFLVGACKKPASFLDVQVHSLTDTRRNSGLRDHWDYTMSNTTATVLEKILASTAKAAEAGRVSAVVVSSLTGLNEGLQAGLAGPPTSERKGGGMDVSKWQDLERQVISIRNRLQKDTHHTLWEAHVRTGKKLVGNKEEFFEEVDAGSGAGGKSFGANVDFIFRLRRETSKYEGTQVDRCFVDTKPSMGTFTTGRKALALADRETDMVEMFKKLGKKTHGKPLEVA